jgi:hypothetical protein
MEEIVWVLIGVIGIIFVFGIIASFAYKGGNDNDILTTKNALEAMAMQSEKVCQMPMDTYLSVDVNLVRDTVVESDDGTICLELDDERFCRKTTCKNNYVKNDLGEELNLNLTDAPFRSHEYKCFFLRLQENIVFECKG